MADDGDTLSVCHLEGDLLDGVDVPMAPPHAGRSFEPLTQAGCRVQIGAVHDVEAVGDDREVGHQEDPYEISARQKNTKPMMELRTAQMAAPSQMPGWTGRAMMHQRMSSRIS